MRRPVFTTMLLTGSRIIDHIESRFDNLASVNTNGIDGGVSYALDTKLRRLGDFGTFVIGAQGTFLNQYLIDSPRALREYYRDGDNTTPKLRANDTRDYSRVHAEYDAAGYRNLENFAPPLPKMRLSVPLSWIYAGHMLGVAMRYIGSYYDDSENTIEKYGLAPRGQSLGDLAKMLEKFDGIGFRRVALLGEEICCFLRIHSSARLSPSEK